jgi:hypothetical protein
MISRIGSHHIPISRNEKEVGDGKAAKGKVFEEIIARHKEQGPGVFQLGAP